MPVTPVQQLSQWFEPATLQRGKAYFNKGAVTNYHLLPNGIEGTIDGSFEEEYSTKVTVKWSGNKLVALDSRCSCPVGYLCKHGVALAMVMLAERKPGSSQPSPALQRWYQSLEQVAQPITKPAATNTNEVVYLLSIGTHHGTPTLQCLPHEAKRLKSGSWGKTVRQVRLQHSRESMTVDDYRLAGILRYAEDYGGNLLPQRAANLLSACLQSGRCYWQDLSRDALHESSAMSGRLDWQPGAEKKLSIKLSMDSAPLAIALPIDPPWFIDPDTGRCGPLELNCEPQFATALLAAPPVSKQEAGDVTRQLLKLTAGSVPTPVRLTVADDVSAAEPILHIGAEAEHQLELNFRYGSAVASYRPNAEQLVIQRNDEWLTYPRQTRVEKDCAERLNKAGLSQPLRHKPQLFIGQSTEQWLDFLQTEAPALQEDGWTLQYADGYQPLQVIDGPEWFAEGNAAGSDWFSLEVGILVDGIRVNLLPLLVSWLRTLPAQVRLDHLQEDVGDQAWVEMEDSRWLKLPLSRLQPIFNTLLELYDDQPLDRDGLLKLPNIRSQEINDLALEATGLAWETDAVTGERGERMRAFDGIESINPPTNLQATLRPYQQQGLSWLNYLREMDFGGILADDMGLGKTLQTLALLLNEKNQRPSPNPSLIVAPTSLLSNWKREAARFTPDIKVVVLHGKDRAQHRSAARDADLVITSYPLLVRDAEWYGHEDWHYLVLDEAQTIKNPRSKAARELRKLPSRHRLCLTGTPMENHLDELWSLMEFLVPGLLGDHKSFQKTFRAPIEKQGNTARREALGKRIKPFLLRRTKQEVAKDLPPKTEIVRTIPLTGKQLDLYETLRVALDQQLQAEIARRGLANSQIAVLDALLKLRQVCCDPQLVHVEAAKGVQESAKRDLLMELLPELIDEGHSVLLFSQFTSMLKIIETDLQNRNINYVKLTGQTKDRDTPVEQFQNGDVKVFLISLKAGGVGLNLTRADAVIHYDPWWNPAAEAQATDRAHRIGQTRPVMVYKLLTENTIEDRIQALQERKRALYDAVLSDGAASDTKLAATDIGELFKPISPKLAL